MSGDTGRISDRTYPAPIDGADWTVSATDQVAATLAILLSQHIPFWPGATDAQLEAVARETLAALDDWEREQPKSISSAKSE